MTLSFEAHARPHAWAPRRYQPVIKDESAYAVLYRPEAGEHQVCTRWSDDFEELIGWASPQSRSDAQAATELVDAITKVKRAHSSMGGGKFRINEYGQVLVPTGRGGIGSVYCVGTMSGHLSFEHPLSGAVFDLRGAGLEPGDPWERPVVALRYTVHNDNRVSIEKQPDRYEKERVFARSKLQDLGRAARNIRGQDGFALFVNDQRVAVVKRPPAWNAYFVGTIDLESWFSKEDC